MTFDEIYSEGALDDLTSQLDFGKTLEVYEAEPFPPDDEAVTLTLRWTDDEGEYARLITRVTQEIWHFQSLTVRETQEGFLAELAKVIPAWVEPHGFQQFQAHSNDPLARLAFEKAGFLADEGDLMIGPIDRIKSYGEFHAGLTGEPEWRKSDK